MDRKEEVFRIIGLAQNGNRKICVWGCGQTGTKVGFEMLLEIGIHPNYFCDSNTALVGKNIVGELRCNSISYLINDNPIVFVMVAEYCESDVCKRLMEMKIYDYITCSEIIEIYAQTYMPFMKKNQIAIYTCVTNGYDEVEEPNDVIPNADYFYISDRELDRPSIFSYVNINDVLPTNITEETRKNRYCKINAHKLFPQYRYSIYYDGSFKLKQNIAEYISQIPKAGVIPACRAPWKSPYIEAMRRCVTQRDSKEIILGQVEQYWLEGMPDDIGVYYCGILIREHNSPICKKIMEEWWNEIMKHSKRDQISFPYVLWKNGFTYEDMAVVNDKSFTEDNDYYVFSLKHKKDRERL